MVLTSADCGQTVGAVPWAHPSITIAIAKGKATRKSAGVPKEHVSDAVVIQFISYGS